MPGDLLCRSSPLSRMCNTSLTNLQGGSGPFQMGAPQKTRLDGRDRRRVFDGRGNLACAPQRGMIRGKIPALFTKCSYHCHDFALILRYDSIVPNVPIISHFSLSFYNTHRRKALAVWPGPSVVRREKNSRMFTKNSCPRHGFDAIIL